MTRLKAPPDTPTRWVLALLDVVGSGPPGSRQRQCPAHQDTTPSLSVGQGREGQALLHCQAGCKTTDVLTSLNLDYRDLREVPLLLPEEHATAYELRTDYPPVERRGGSSPQERGMRYEAAHQYTDDHRLVRYRHPTTGAKELAWETRDGNTWSPGLREGVTTRDMPLYREREVRMAVAAREPVVVCESESSVDALTAKGIYATTWAGGASTPNVERLREVLTDADVVIVPDHDDPGLECGRTVWRALAGSSRRSHVLPDPGQDARDLLAQQGPDAFTVKRDEPELAWDDDWHLIEEQDCVDDADATG